MQPVPRIKAHTKFCFQSHRFKDLRKPTPVCWWPWNFILSRRSLRNIDHSGPAWGVTLGLTLKMLLLSKLSSEDVGLIVGDLGDGGDFPALLMAFQRFIGSGLGSPRVWGRVDIGNNSKRDDHHLTVCESSYACPPSSEPGSQVQVHLTPKLLTTVVFSNRHV